MQVTATDLPGVLLVEPRVHADARGFFFESYSAERYREAGIACTFVQDNHSCSAASTIRGFHYQLKQPQAKLVRVVRGAILDVAVDIRVGSPTFGRWVGCELSADNKRQLFIPVGFAHAFCALADGSEVEYKCSAYYDPADQQGIAWNDPTIGVSWPVALAIISDKDRQYGSLEKRRSEFPNYQSGNL